MLSHSTPSKSRFTKLSLMVSIKLVTISSDMSVLSVGFLVELKTRVSLPVILQSRYLIEGAISNLK